MHKLGFDFMKKKYILIIAEFILSKRKIFAKCEKKEISFLKSFK